MGLGVSAAAAGVVARAGTGAAVAVVEVEVFVASVRAAAAGCVQAAVDPPSLALKNILKHVICHELWSSPSVIDVAASMYTMISVVIYYS